MAKPRKSKTQLNEEKARRALEGALQELARSRGLIAAELNRPKLSDERRNYLSLLDGSIVRTIALLDWEQYYDKVRTVSVVLILKAAGYMLGAAASVAQIKSEFVDSAKVIEQHCIVIESHDSQTEADRDSGPEAARDAAINFTEGSGGDLAFNFTEGAGPDLGINMTGGAVVSADREVTASTGAAPAVGEPGKSIDVEITDSLGISDEHGLTLDRGRLDEGRLG